jgi:hypothetical protein
MLLETFSTIDWSSPIRFERNFSFLLTIRTSYLMHFSFTKRHVIFHLLIIISRN